MTQLTPTHPKPRQVDAAPVQKSDIRKKLRLLIPIGLLLVAGGVGVRYWFTQPNDSVIRLSGRLEGYESDLGAKVGGRIEAIAVREGDTVQQGEVIAQLDDEEVQAQLEAARARVAAAQQQVNQAQLQIAVVESQLLEAQLTLQQSEGDTSGRVSESQLLSS